MSGSFGFSLLDYRWNANFNESIDYIKNITENALKNGIPKGVVLNVNIPSIEKSKIKKLHFYTNEINDKNENYINHGTSRRRKNYIS